MSSPAPLPKRRWWRLRRVWLIAAFLALLGSVPFAIPFYQDWRVDQDLAALLAETDRLDPGWRWEELQAKRVPVPDAENAFPVLAKIGKAFPNYYNPTFKDLPLPEGMFVGSLEHLDWIYDIQAKLEDLPDVNQLNAQQIEALESEWKQHRLMFDEARKLRAYQKHQLPAGLKSAGTIHRFRSASSLLRLELLRHCHEERLDDALTQIDAMVAVNLLQRDEADAIAPLVQCATTTIMCESMKRVLAQGEPDAKRLAKIQSAMQAQEEFPRFLNQVRLQRAEMWKGYLDLMKTPVAEQIETMKMIQNMANWGNDKKEEEPPWYLAWFRKKQHFDPRRWVFDEHQNANRWHEFAKLSEDEQRQKFEGFFPDQRKLLSVFPKYHQAHWRVGMELRATCTAIALEHFRQKHGAWPKSLEQLVPDYLDKVPKDIYTGKTLTYRLVDRGAIVYSIGQDKTDNGGKLRPDNTGGLDIGVRLWNPEHRRQAPLPPVVPRAAFQDIPP